MSQPKYSDGDCRKPVKLLTHALQAINLELLWQVAVCSVPFTELCNESNAGHGIENAIKAALQHET